MGMLVCKTFPGRSRVLSLKIFADKRLNIFDDKMEEL